MKQSEVLAFLMSVLDSRAIVISTLGLISREIFEKYDSMRNFYVPGSMGLASSIGLGIALQHKRRTVCVIDGDGSLLMNLGCLVTIGTLAPSNLVHIVLDNHAYASCSGEETLSSSRQLRDIAQAAGYITAHCCCDEHSIEQAILKAEDAGPSFVLIQTEPGGRRDFIRPLELPDLKRRFMDFLAIRG